MASYDSILKPSPNDRWWHTGREQDTDIEFPSLAMYLPTPCKRMIDIGSGLARMPIRIAFWMRAHQWGLASDFDANQMDAQVRDAVAYPHIMLMDGDKVIPKTGKERTGYHTDVQEGAWSDVRVGAERVAMYLQGGTTVTCLKPDPAAMVEPVDLVTSFRSWGHHYPIGYYLPFVRRALRVDGVLIVDIRNGTDGIPVLRQSGFTLLSANLHTKTSKCQRCAFRFAPEW